MVVLGGGGRLLMSEVPLHSCTTTTAAKYAFACSRGSYLRPIDSCITQLKAQGPIGTCNESKEEEKKKLTGCDFERRRNTFKDSKDFYL